MPWKPVIEVLQLVRRLSEQRYVLALLPAALVANLVLGRELPLELERTSVVIDAECGMPQAICMDDEGRTGPGEDVFASTRTLVKAHLERFAAALSNHVRMSPRVVTSSAAFLAYQVLHMVASKGVTSRCCHDLLFGQRRWADGSANPFFQPVRTQAHGRPGMFKRVCCLSYTVAEVGRCGSCPLD